MRPRIVRSAGTVEPLPTEQSPAATADLRPVRVAAGAPLTAPELWAGLHIAQFNVSESFRTALLERLATRSQRFTPRVSLVPPDGLLLEVKGSLHLFNGAEGLIGALLDECRTLDIEPVVALAPTPLAALVASRAEALAGGVGLAAARAVSASREAKGHVDSSRADSLGRGASPERAGSTSKVRHFIVTNKSQLVSRLSAMPLAPLRWPPEVLERLARMGVRTLGQVLRLPRAGFARRLGPEYLAELDRLTGRDADLRHPFQPRERFRRRRELIYELESTASLHAVLDPLLQDLGRFLLERQCGITELECWLRHRHAPPSVCRMRLAEPVADVARLTELLGERLNALELPEPVRSCELRSGFPVRRVLASNSLWQPGEYGGSGGPESPELIERLRARLGHESVYGLQVLQGHRPESAWCRREPTRQSVESLGRRGVEPAGRRRKPPVLPWPAFRRPLWLLHAPQQLDEVDGVPRRRGALRFCSDPERIETGWWDGSDVGRDYYTAIDIYGVQLWIFRERAEPHRWFLHGVFG